jgi:hypothetical protein
METTSMPTAALAEFTDALAEAEGANRLVRVLAVHSHALLGVSAVGVMLADSAGELIGDGSPDLPWFADLFDLQHRLGPGYESYRYGRSVAITTTGAHRLGMPMLAAAMAKADVCVADAMPLQVRGRVIGALTVFRADLNPGATERRLGDLVRGLANLAAAKLPFERQRNGPAKLARAQRRAEAEVAPSHPIGS